jgi:cobalt/nickel transport system ATP-binding protein
MPGVHGGDHGPTPYPRAPGAEDAAPAPVVAAPVRRAVAGEPLPDAVLAVEGVTFAYQDGTVALRNLTLDVPRHRKTAILGANGSGKSTLFLHLDGILKPQRGRVLLGGQPVGYERAALNDLRRRVGLVFQDPDSQLFAASVRQDISFGPINLGLPDDVVRQKVAAAVRDTQIEDLVDRPTHLLSYGQKKRVAIAGVLAMEPEVIVADEPTAGLDPEATARLVELLDRLHAGGCTIVISTHDVEMALAWADHVLVMRRGELLGAGPPEVVFADEDLLKSARLVTPIVLDTFLRLRHLGVLDAAARPPRTAAELVDLVAAATTDHGDRDHNHANGRAGDAPSEAGLPGAVERAG